MFSPCWEGSLRDDALVEARCSGRVKGCLRGFALCIDPEGVACYVGAKAFPEKLSRG